MRFRFFSLFVATLSAGILPAEVYLTQDQAAQALLPGSSLRQVELDLTPAEIKAIEKASGERVLWPNLTLLVSASHEVIFIDKVLGKHQYITYAVLLGAEGKVKGVEIMEYTETYGKQVMEKKWRDEFVGKGRAADLRVGKDIDAISGATLSATHIAAGVRRVIQTYWVVRDRLP